MNPSDFSPSALDIAAFARSGVRLEGQLSLLKCERLAQDLCRAKEDMDSNSGICQPASIAWTAKGQQKTTFDGATQVWLYITAQMQAHMTCQRCLEPVSLPLEIERSFRFVHSEAEANAQDLEAEEDLLIISKSLDLLALIEDELILALPMVPMHESCPVSVKLSACDADFHTAQNAKPHAFAVLGRLKVHRG